MFNVHTICEALHFVPNSAENVVLYFLMSPAASVMMSGWKFQSVFDQKRFPPMILDAIFCNGLRDKMVFISLNLKNDFTVLFCNRQTPMYSLVSGSMFKGPGLHSLVQLSAGTIIQWADPVTAYSLVQTKMCRLSSCLRLHVRGPILLTRHQLKGRQACLRWETSL